MRDVRSVFLPLTLLLAAACGGGDDDSGDPSGGGGGTDLPAGASSGTGGGGASSGATSGGPGIAAQGFGLLSADVHPHELVALGGKLVVSTTDYRLWVSDGSPAGTRLLFDRESPERIATEGYYPLRNTPQLAGSRLVFDTLAGAGRNLWATDGTEAGTVQIGTVALNKTVARSDTKLYFDGVDGRGRELWVTDGTAAGTHLVKDLEPSGDSHPLTESRGIVSGGSLYFTHFDTVNRHQLWKTNADDTDVVQLTAGPTYESGLESDDMVEFQGKVYFAFDGGGGRVGLWRTDGTPGGTELVIPTETLTYPYNFRMLGERLIFQAQSQADECVVYYSTDGTVAGTVPFGAPACNQSGEVKSPIIGNTLLFSSPIRGVDATPSTTLYRADGTAGGTSAIATEGLLQANMFANLDAQRVVFFGYPSGEPWVTDGTAAGTLALGELNPGLGSKASSGNDRPEVVVLGGKAYFTANVGDYKVTGVRDYRLYETDGTPAGTRELPLPSGVVMGASDPFVFENMLVFAASKDGDDDSTLWRYVP